MREETKTVYVAENGSVFVDKEECLEYELEIERDELEALILKQLGVNEDEDFTPELMVRLLSKNYSPYLELLTKIQKLDQELSQCGVVPVRVSPGNNVAHHF